jgi:hypothetical protein
MTRTRISKILFDQDLDGFVANVPEHPLIALNYKAIAFASEITSDYCINVLASLDDPLDVVIEIKTPGFEIADEGERVLREATRDYAAAGYGITFKFDASTPS